MKLSYDIEHTVAILIGTGNYQTTDFIQIKPVKGNLEDLKKLLLDKDIFGLPEKRIVVLEDRTNIEILEILTEALSDENLKTVFIYYTGHGHRISKDQLYLTAYNSKKAFHLIKKTAIEFIDIKSAIENSPAKPNSIIIIDACYSGIITGQSEEVLSEEEKTITGSYIITSSSKKDQSFFDPNGKHTFFTEQLIDILSNGSEKHDMLLSISDIYGSLQKRMRQQEAEPQRNDKFDSEVFYFAKNRKFNKEFFLRKAEEYFKSGNYSRALDYYYTLQEKFNDRGYSKQIEKCKKEIEYSTLIIEADSLYSNKKYEQALEKYNDAKELKSDSSLLYKINQCENYVRMRKELLEEHQREIEEGKRKEQEEQKSKQEEERLRKVEKELKIKEAEELRQKQQEEALKRKQKEEELERKQEEELKKKIEEESKKKKLEELKSKNEVISKAQNETKKVSNRSKVLDKAKSEGLIFEEKINKTNKFILVGVCCGIILGYLFIKYYTDQYFSSDYADYNNFYENVTLLYLFIGSLTFAILIITRKFISKNKLILGSSVFLIYVTLSFFARGVMQLSFYVYLILVILLLRPNKSSSVNKLLLILGGAISLTIMVEISNEGSRNSVWDFTVLLLFTIFPLILVVVLLFIGWKLLSQNKDEELKKEQSKIDYKMSASESIQKYWWALNIRGVLFLIFGFIALVLTEIEFSTLLFYFGFLVIFSGIFLTVEANIVKDDNRGLRILEGIFYILIGLLYFFVDFDLTSLRPVITIWAIIAGIFQIVYAIRLRKVLPKEWLGLLNGSITMIFGLLVFTDVVYYWYQLILVFGIYSIISGILMISLSIKVKSFKVAS